MNYYDSVLPASWLMDIFYFYLFANSCVVLTFVVRIFIRTLDRFRYRRNHEERMEEYIRDLDISNSERCRDIIKEIEKLKKQK